MKKFLSLVLALAMVFSLAACGGNGDTPASNPPADNSQAARTLVSPLLSPP